MTALAPMPSGPLGTLTAPDTITLVRTLPGPAERVWRYLTDSDLRRKWLASGTMELRPGADFNLTWHNDTLTNPPGTRPEGFGEQHTMPCRILAADPPRHLSFAWPGVGEVAFDLQPQGDEVILTVTHRLLPSRETSLMVGAGWHAHLDILVATLRNLHPAPFWDSWTRLKSEYDARLPG